MNRESLIAAILDAAARPCPQIVEVPGLRHKATGKVCGIHGLPFNFQRNDYESISLGFAYRDGTNGTTYGTRAKTQQELIEQHEARERTNRAQFAAVLAEATDEQVLSQASYWIPAIVA